MVRLNAQPKRHDVFESLNAVLIFGHDLLDVARQGINKYVHRLCVAQCGAFFPEVQAGPRTLR